MMGMERLHLSLLLANLLNHQVEAVQVVIVVPFLDKRLPILSLGSHTVNFNTIHNNNPMSYQGSNPVLAYKLNKR